MKVIHLLLTGEPGGIETLAHDIARYSRQETVVWFLFRGGAIADRMEASGVKVVVAHTPRYRWGRKIAEFVRYCREEQVDVVVNHMDSPVACAHILALKRALPHVKIFGYLHNDVRAMTVSLKHRLGYIPFIKAMHRCCEKVFAISEFVKSAGMEAYGLPEDKIAVVYNGVDVGRFSALESREAEHRMELIFVGRLIPEKGVHVLLKALSLLEPEIDCHTTIVGFGREYENLIKQAQELQLVGKADFLGKRTDVPELLQKADYFVHPAIWQEGFGITLIEAMAAGKPCIAFRGGAIPEIIDHGVDGFHVELGSAEAMAEAIREAYRRHNTDAYRQMSAAARQKANTFHIENMVQRLESFYGQFAETSG